MASREDLIQARSIYIGTSTNLAPNTSNLIVDGLIGVGTTNPGERVSISGNVGFQYFGTQKYHVGYYSGGLNFAETNIADARLFIKDGGNVGIGILNPQERLEVAGNIYVNGGNGEGLKMNGGMSIFRQNGADLTFNTSASERMRITSAGLVGIGTSSPGYQLEVNGWVGALRYYPYNTNSSYIDGDGSGIRLNGPGYFYSAVSGGSYFEGPMRVRNSISNDTNSYLQINGGTANITYFAGTVGVGFTTMYHNASLSVANKLFIGQSNNTDIGGTIYGYWDSGYQAYAGGLKFQVFNANGGFPYTMKDSMTLSGSGNIGISTTNPIASLDNQGGLGTYRQRGITTMTTDILYADGTNATRYEIARVTIDYNDWNETGTIEIDLYEKYYSDGLKKRYIVSYGWASGYSKYLVEMSGTGNNNMQVSIGTPVIISGDIRYLPIYIDLRYYSRCNAIVRTNRNLTTNNPPWVGEIWFNNAPSMTYIGDFSPDSTVYAGNVIGGNTIFPSGNVGIGTSAPPARLAVAGNNAGLALIGDAGLTHYTGISLNNNLSSGTYNFLSSPYDNSLFINRPSGNNINFRENNVDQMVIRYGGLVGINTTNPQGYLDVNTGSANMTTYDYGVDLKVNAGGGFARSNRQYDVQSAITSFLGSYGNSTNGVERAYWTIGDRNSDITGYTLTNGIHLLANGNVGIGTANPTAKLQVEGNGIVINTENSNQSKFLYFRYSNGGDLRSDSYLTFSTSGSPTERMRITDVGNVGIGTTAPVNLLQLTSHNPIQRFESGKPIEWTTDGEALGSINFYKHYGLAQGAAIRMLQDGGTSSYVQAALAFYTNNGSIDWTTPIERMRISNQGYIGIGTSTPNKQLTFVQAADDAIQIRRLTTTQGNPSVGTGISWTWSDSTTDNETWAAIRAILPGGGNSIITFSTTPYGGQSNLTERMWITDSGRVGIGTANPYYSLHVQGTDFMLPATLGLTHYLGVGAPLDFYMSANAFGDASLNLSLSTNLTFNINYSEVMRIQPDGSVGIGTSYVDPSAILDVASRRKGFLPPRMSNSDMNAIPSPAEGLIVYDITNKKVTVFNGSSWVPLH